MVLLSSFDPLGNTESYKIHTEDEMRRILIEKEKNETNIIIYVRTKGVDDKNREEFPSVRRKFSIHVAYDGIFTPFTFCNAIQVPFQEFNHPLLNQLIIRQINTQLCDGDGGQKN